MSAGYQELFLEQGTTFVTTITLDDVYGTPYDLTNVTAKSQVRKSYYSTSPTADFVISIPVPTNGSITLTLGSEQTSNIAAGRYVYDVIIKDQANTVTRVLEGIVNVIPQVTRF
jgi:hypothetical protein